MVKKTVTEKEQQTVGFMIRYYCRRKHNIGEVCEECNSLIEYTANKLETCRYGNMKPVCQKCETHCYNKEKRKKIREVMRYSGPRMIFVNPLMAIQHIIHTRKSDLHHLSH